MSYLSQSDSWGSGSGVTDIVQSKSAPWVIDFSKKRAAQKGYALKTFGYYKNPDGSPRRIPITGSVVPVTSYENGWALLLYWEQVGDMMLSAAKAHDEKTSLTARSIADQVKPIVDRFKSTAARWRSKWAVASIVGSDWDRGVELWDTILSTYVIELNNKIWTGFNIESVFERAIWATKEAAKDLGKTIIGPMDDMLKAGDDLWKLIKWGTIGTVVLFGVWAGSKMFKKGGAT